MSNVERGIREYNEGFGAEIKKENGRWVIEALNEHGYNFTSVDLLDVINCYKEKVSSCNECPNGCGELSNAKNKSVPFVDGKLNEIAIRVELIWCPRCYHVQEIERV